MSILPKKKRLEEKIRQQSQPKQSKKNRTELLRVNGDLKRQLRSMILGGLDAKWILITPPLAREMMKYNEDDEWHNRPQSALALERFRAAMKKGWKLTGETIIFSRSGRLLNGQHRLIACDESGMAFPCLVVFGVEDDVFKYIDIGTRRTAAHIFAIEDIPNYAAVAAACRVVKAYDQRAISGRQISGVILPVENEELLEWYRNNERIQESVHYGRMMRREGYHSVAVGTALHYICARKNRAKADEFFQTVGEGLGLKKDWPEYRLRKVLDDSAKNEKARLHWATKAAYTIIAWNASREGRSLRTLTWRTESRPDEPFPVAI